MHVKIFATATARALTALGIHYGWLMVALTFLFGVCSAGAMSIPGVLLTPISNDLGWSIGELYGPLGLRRTLFARAADRTGVRGGKGGIEALPNEPGKNPSCRSQVVGEGSAADAYLSVVPKPREQVRSHQTLNNHLN